MILRPVGVLVIVAAIATRGVNSGLTEKEEVLPVGIVVRMMAGGVIVASTVVVALFIAVSASSHIQTRGTNLAVGATVTIGVAVAGHSETVVTLSEAAQRGTKDKETRS